VREQLLTAPIGITTAAESYRELVTLDPGNADLRNNPGIMLARMGDLAGDRGI
jgi:Tfp pilus assembly protein PilF